MNLTVLKRLINDVRGATAIEYGLLAGLIAVAAIGAFNSFADETNLMFNRVSSAVQSAPNS